MLGRWRQDLARRFARCAQHTWLTGAQRAGAGIPGADGPRRPQETRQCLVTRTFVLFPEFFFLVELSFLGRLRSDRLQKAPKSSAGSSGLGARPLGRYNMAWPPVKAPGRFQRAGKRVRRSRTKTCHTPASVSLPAERKSCLSPGVHGSHRRRGDGPAAARGVVKGGGSEALCVGGGAAARASVWAGSATWAPPERKCK